MVQPDLPCKTYRKIDFSRLLELQTDETALVRDGGPGCILFAELNPVITLGRRQELGQVAFAATATTASGIPIVSGDRGGLETWHGPGQWVVFVIARLEEWTGSSIGIRAAVAKYLNAAKETARHFGVDAEVDLDKCVGLWMREPLSESSGKLASVGIRIRDGILQSGMSLNIYPTETSFATINPCGIADAKPAFLISDPSKLSPEELEQKMDQGRVSLTLWLKSAS